MVGDLHAEGGVGLLCDHVPDLAQTDNAQNVVARVARCKGRVFVGVSEGLWVGGVGGLVGPGEVAEHRQDQEDGHVGHGFR